MMPLSLWGVGFATRLQQGNGTQASAGELGDTAAYYNLGYATIHLIRSQGVCDGSD